MWLCDFLANSEENNRPRQQKEQKQRQAPPLASLLDLEPWVDSSSDANPNALVNSLGMHRSVQSWGVDEGGSSFGDGGDGGGGLASNDWWQMSPLDASKLPPASYAAVGATQLPTAAPPASDEAWNAIKNENSSGNMNGWVKREMSVNIWLYACKHRALDSPCIKINLQSPLTTAQWPNTEPQIHPV